MLKGGKYNNDNPYLISFKQHLTVINKCENMNETW